MVFAVTVPEAPKEIAVPLTVTELFARLAFVMPAVPESCVFVKPEILAKGTVPEAKLSAFKDTNEAPDPT